MVGGMADFVSEPVGFVNGLRVANTIIGFVAVCLLLFLVGVPRWKEWDPAKRLRWMALVLLVFTGTYGTIEVLYFTTNFRVPMVTLSLIWAIASVVYPCIEERRARKR